MGFWKVPQDWIGRTAVIIAGGPSIKRLGQGNLIPRLRGKFPVIAISQSYELAPWADVLMWMDQSWLDLNWRNLHHHTGLKATVRLPEIKAINDKEEGYPHWLWMTKLLQFVSDDNVDLETDPKKVRGLCSAHMAINLAYHFGVRRIVGLGYDMRDKEPDGFNWHDRPQARRITSKPDTFNGLYLPYMRALKPALEKHGVEFYNANPESALRCYPFVDLEEVINTWT